MTKFEKLPFPETPDVFFSVRAQGAAAIRAVAGWRKAQMAEGLCACNDCLYDLADEIEGK